MLRHSLTLLLLLPMVACASTAIPPENATGAEIYGIADCAGCHGDDFDGTMFGPGLKDVDLHWNPSALAGFFAAPESIIESDARLTELDKEYWFDMPDYDHIPPRQREILAIWLLEQAKEK